MKTWNISISAPKQGLTEAIVVQVQRPTTLPEGIAKWKEEGLVSLAVRDENSNAGNHVRSVLVAKLTDNPATPRAELDALAQKAIGEFESKVFTLKTGTGGASGLAKFMAWLDLPENKSVKDLFVAEAMKTTFAAAQTKYFEAYTKATAAKKAATPAPAK
jgi:hypothetical protein